VAKHQLLDLSYKQREPRGAIDMSVSYKDSALRIIATHLGLLPSERRSQTRKLLDWIGAPADDPEDITLLIGDLNEWSLWGRPLRWLRSWFGSVKAPATYPTRWPLFALDRIWANPQLHIIDIKTHRSALAKIASDHYPIVATLDW
ncbi:MAG: endonuclease, partial [Thioalkalispiraceae bacterium]